MDTVFDFLFQFLGQFFGSFWSIITGIFNGIAGMFNFPKYVEIINDFTTELGGLAWVIAIIAIILLAAVMALIVWLIVVAVKKFIKIDRGVDGLFKYDFTLGALGAQALKAEMISTAGEDMSALPNNKNLQCLYIVKDSKKVTLYSGAHRTLKVIKNFRGTTDINACRDLVVENMKNADKTCAYVTYKTVDKNEVSNFAKFLKSDADIRVTRTFHNKTQKDGKSSIGIYFYKRS